MIINIVSLIILAIFTYIFSKKIYNKLDSNFEKVLFWLYVSFASFILIMYYFDRFDVPSNLKWNKNVDTQNWLMVLSNFGTVILAEVLGGIILIYVTIMQIKDNNDNNYKRDKEERRINNLPLLNYTFLQSYTGSDNAYVLPSMYNNGVSVKIIMKIKNIGMNAIRRCYIKISGKSLKNTCFCPLDIQSCLDKGEEKTIAFLIELPFNIYKYNLEIYYEDLLHNWYSQKIKLDYEVINISDGIRYYVKPDYEVFDEKIIDEPKIKFNINKYM